jgi:hypothetical protein
MWEEDLEVPFVFYRVGDREKLDALAASFGTLPATIIADNRLDPDALLQEVDTLLRRRAEARDRLMAQQTLLPIAAAPVAAPATARPRRRR